MRVALGTVEIEDDVRKAVRKRTGGKGHATRSELKDYYLELVENHNKLLVAGAVDEPAPVQTEWTGEPSQLPEPTADGDSTPA